jgi:hypothetical protein
MSIRLLPPSPCVSPGPLGQLLRVFKNPNTSQEIQSNENGKEPVDALFKMPISLSGLQHTGQP